MRNTSFAITVSLSYPPISALSAERKGDIKTNLPIVTQFANDRTNSNYKDNFMLWAAV